MNQPREVDPVRAAADEAIILASYDARWPFVFDAERTRLMSQFPQLLAIEHIGSTAVPGMIAKPIVDMMAGVQSMAIAGALFDPIVAFGYHTSRAFNDMLPDRRWFMRAMHGKRTHHLHVVVFNESVWHEHLEFRDALRSDALLASRYVDLKTALAARYQNDREAYTDGKDAFVAAALSRR